MNHSRHSALFPNTSSRFLRYGFLTISLTIIFCLALFTAGLGGNSVQQRINASALNSIAQFESEGMYPHVFDNDDQSMRLDNFTDITIVQECILMNTADNPQSILTNPRVSKTYTGDSISDKLTALHEAATANQGNSYYYYYWMGFRVLYRPLMIFMDYPEIRAVVTFAFILLFTAASISVHQFTGSIAFTISFTASIAAMNISIIASELQFVTIFLLMFAFIILLPRYMKTHKSLPMLFFIFGACTQYFDFYTVPLITLGFPLVFMLRLSQKNTATAKIKLVLSCSIAWLFAYGLFWLIRLVLVTLFTDYNAFSIAFSRFSTWTGISQNANYEKFTPIYTLALIFQKVIQPSNIFWLIVLSVAYLIAVVIAFYKKRISRPSPLYIFVGILPILWAFCSSRATGNHAWFQYRMLSVSLFSLSAFFCDTIRPQHNISP